MNKIKAVLLERKHSGTNKFPYIKQRVKNEAEKKGYEYFEFVLDGEISENELMEFLPKNEGVYVYVVNPSSDVGHAIRMLCYEKELGDYRLPEETLIIIEDIRNIRRQRQLSSVAV